MRSEADPDVVISRRHCIARLGQFEDSEHTATFVVRSNDQDNRAGSWPTIFTTLFPAPVHRLVMSRTGTARLAGRESRLRL